MTKIKICGITNLEDAAMVNDLRADAIGFNFFRDSPRFVSPELAARITESVGMRMEKVGVFVNLSIDEIIEIEDAVPLDTIQLHGDESPEFIAELRSESDATIIKAVRIDPQFDANSVLSYGADAILIDAYSEGGRGGTGLTVDRAIARQIAELVDQVYLAGGLTPENVALAINAVRPFAVDVASGVESSPGIKDPTKVKAFIEAVRNTAVS